MFGRFVKMEGGREIFVCCTPQTPWSEILMRAARQMEQEEREAARNDPATAGYREAIRKLNQTSGQR